MCTQTYAGVINYYEDVGYFFNPPEANRTESIYYITIYGELNNILHIQLSTINEIPNLFLCRVIRVFEKKKCVLGNQKFVKFQVVSYDSY